MEPTVLLDDGTLERWQSCDGGPARWEREGEAVVVTPGRGDLCSREWFGDGVLQLEFRLPAMPGATGQAKANSGVFLQGLYEIQILDSHHLRLPGTGDCAAVYRQHAPLVNACAPAGRWQRLAVVFRAARGQGVDPARLSAWLNGVPVHNNVALRGPTQGALDRPEGEEGPLRLQDHGDPVAFRRIRFQRLPSQGYAGYAGY